MAAEDKLWNPSEKTKAIIEKETVTPEEVREVIVECFCQAHGDYEQAMFILKQQSIEAGMLWNKPTKAGITRLLPMLAKVARSFRNPDLIIQNRTKVETLLAKCVEA